MSSDDDKFENEINDILHSFDASLRLPVQTQSTTKHGSMDGKASFYDDLKDEISNDIDEMLVIDAQISKYMKLLLDVKNWSSEEIVVKYNAVSSELLFEMQNNTKIYQAYYRLALHYRELKNKQKGNIRTITYKNTELQNKFDNISAEFNNLKVQYHDLNNRYLAKSTKSDELIKLNLNEEISSLSRDNEQLAQRLHSSEKTNTRLEIMIKNLRLLPSEKEKTHLKNIEVLKNEIKNFESEIKKLKDAVVLKEKEYADIEENWNRQKLLNDQLKNENRTLSESNEKLLADLQFKSDKKLISIQNEVLMKNENTVLKEEIKNLTMELEKVILQYREEQHESNEKLKVHNNKNEELILQNNKLVEQLRDISKNIESLRTNGLVQIEEFKRMNNNLKLEIIEAEKNNNDLNMQLLEANEMNSQLSHEISLAKMELERQRDINYYNFINNSRNNEHSSFTSTDRPMTSRTSMYSIPSIPTTRSTTSNNLVELKNIPTSRISRSQTQNNLSADANQLSGEVRSSYSLTSKNYELQSLDNMNLKRSSTFNNTSMYPIDGLRRSASYNPKRSNSSKFIQSNPPKSISLRKKSLDENTFYSKANSKPIRTKSEDLSTQWETTKLRNFLSSAPKNQSEYKLNSERLEADFLEVSSLIDHPDVADYDPDVDEDDIHHMETIQDSPRWISKPKIKLKRDFSPLSKNLADQHEI